MVQLTSRPPLGGGLLVLALLSGVAAVAIGVGLVPRVETGFGAVWALGFVALGALVLISVVALRWPGAVPPPRDAAYAGEPARFHPRRTGLAGAATFLVLGILGAWCAAIGVVGAIEESWAWPVLAAVPAIYFSGFVLLALAGRLRPGGVWVTPTRVVDEHLGLRRELALADVGDLSPRSDTLHVTPRPGAVVAERRLAPRPWGARSPGAVLVIRTDDLDGGSRGLAAELQRPDVPRSR